MELGMIGLGRMGANMTERLVNGGHRVVGFDPKPEARAQVEAKGAMAQAVSNRSCSDRLQDFPPSAQSESPPKRAGGAEPDALLHGNEVAP